MLIPLMLALAAADGANGRPFKLVRPTVSVAPEQRGWLPKKTEPFTPTLLATPLKGLSAARVEPGDPTIVCGIRVIRPDPKFDAGMVRQAPKNIDPKIVRKADCPG